MKKTLRINLAVLLCVLALCLATTFAFSESHPKANQGTQTFVPAGGDAQIDPEITATMKVSHPDATGFVYSLKELMWAPYVAPKEFDRDGGHEVLRPTPRPGGPEVPDEAMQTSYGPEVLSFQTAGVNVDGLGANITGPNGTFVVDSVPPDTNMAVGTTQLVETVNSGFAVYNKTGTMIAGPYNLTALWSVLPANSPCTGVDGSDGVSISDPVVVHDQLAQRWLITVLALPYNASTGALIAPFYHCVAISATDDATGSWSVFEYNPGSFFSGGTNDLPDYPKMGVWRDTYAFTYDMFNSTGSSYVAAEICGMDRNAMLNGTTITIICFKKASTDYALLPPNIDGATYPNLQTSGSAGTDTCTVASPCQPKSIFFELNDVTGATTVINYYRAHFNFVTTSHSAVDTLGTVTVASYNNTDCTNSQQCAVQPTHTGSLPAGEVFASESKLDTLAVHAMWRSAYRNFGSFESVVFDSTVRGTAASTAEPRWYEFRGINTTTGTGTPTVQQQSTWNPDTNVTFRFMGSIAADHNNDMLLGYTGSNSSIFPSLYVAGRAAGDTASTLEGEIVPFSGLNSQVNITEGGNSYAYGYRWGDYSSMDLDPDDCTFWYANMYLAQAGLFNWSTHMVNLDFPACTNSASITLPIPNGEGGAQLTSGTATFYWTSGSGGPTGYTLSVGSTQGSSNYCSNSYGAGVYQAAVSCLPIDGSTFWVRIATTGGAGGFNDYQYAAALLVQSQTITVTQAPPPSATYGSSFPVAATASSGLTVAITASGACSVTSGGSASATITMEAGSGTCSVIFKQAGNGAYSAAPTVTDTSSATPAVLTVSANNANMNYGDAAFPTFSANITGEVNGDGSGVVSGSPAFSTDATLSSAPGQYNIYVTQGTLAAANYTFTFVNAFLNIGMASPATNLAGNPANIGTGDSTTLTATVTGSPNGVAPTGTVTFYLGATELGCSSLGGGSCPGPEASKRANHKRIVTEALLAKSRKNHKGQPEYPGVAATATLSVPASALQMGANSITATYAGDTNYGTEPISATTVTVNAPGIYTPTPGGTLTGYSATFSWYGAAGATAYWIDIGSAPGGNTYYQSGSLPTSTETVTVNDLPVDGSTVYVTLYWLIGGNWVSNPYTYTAFGGSSTLGQITTPQPNTTLTGSTVVFNWNAGSASNAYWLDAGSSPGGNQYYQSGNLGNVFTTTANGLPTDGSTVYVTLYSLVSGQWLSNSYTYTAYNLASQDGVITAPTPGSTLTSSSATFVWTAGSGATNYWLDVGSTSGGNQYLQSGALGNVTTLTVNGLPTDGSTIYVTLYSLVGGVWSGNEVTYTAFSASGGLAVMQTPTPGSTLSGNQVTFTWSAGSGTAYWVDVSNVAAGGNDLDQSGNLGSALTYTIYNLPTDGSTVYVTLYSLVGGQWLSNNYTYVSGP